MLKKSLRTSALMALVLTNLLCGQTARCGPKTFRENFEYGARRAARENNHNPRPVEQEGNAHGLRRAAACACGVAAIAVIWYIVWARGTVKTL